MLTARAIAWTVCASLTALQADLASGQNYPKKPIRVVTGSTGATPNFIMRLIGPEMTTRMGYSIIVENRGGGGGSTAGETVARALPDGYTLLCYGNTLWIGMLIGKMPYDPLRDLVPISLLSTQPNILVVHPSTPANSVTELVALSKAKPGVLNYGSGETGSSNHLAAELFKSMAGVNIVRINYKGAGPAVLASIAGEVQVMFPTAAAATRYVKGGQLKALAVTSTKPSALTPGLPTLAASGLPGYESVATTGLFAPARTPPTILKQLNQEILSVLELAVVRQRLFDAGVEVVGSSPEALTATMQFEMARLGKVIREAGIKAD